MGVGSSGCEISTAPLILFFPTQTPSPHSCQKVAMKRRQRREPPGRRKREEFREGERRRGKERGGDRKGIPGEKKQERSSERGRGDGGEREEEMERGEGEEGNHAPLAVTELSCRGLMKHCSIRVCARKASQSRKLTHQACLHTALGLVASQDSHAKTSRTALARI